MKTEDKAAEVTLQAAKDQVARKYNKKDWDHVLSKFEGDLLDEFIDEAAELYASQVSASKDREIEELKYVIRQCHDAATNYKMSQNQRTVKIMELTTDVLVHNKVPTTISDQSKTIEELKDILKEALEWVEQTKDVRSCDTEAKIKEALNS